MCPVYYESSIVRGAMSLCFRRQPSRNGGLHPDRRQPIGHRAILRSVSLTLMLAAMAGCTVGPDYNGPPEVKLGEGWTLPTPEGKADAALSDWWRALGDPALTRLVEQALAQNLDVRQAISRIAEARALVAASSARSLPVLTGGAVAAPLHQGVNGPLPALGSRDTTLYAFGFDASWEVDLFGSVRRSVESADARLQAVQEDAAAVRISVAAEVARTYLSMRGAQAELAARRMSIETLQRTLDAARRRLAQGDVAQADYNAIQSRLDAGLAGLPAIEARARGAALALGTLLGGLPEDELALLGSGGTLLVVTELPTGQRADLLRRRPDVRAAERKLAASTADIGVATAELFPRLSITALGGFTAAGANPLFLGDSLSGIIAPLISWRVFDGGRVKAEINAAQARHETAALAYEGAVLNALGDAERALSQFRFARQAYVLQQQAVVSIEQDFRNAQRRYQSGDIGLVELLDAERQLRDAQEGLARAQSNAAIDLVSLYKSLGGGWGAPQAEVINPIS